MLIVREENEERIVVKELASLIRSSREKLKSQGKTHNKAFYEEASEFEKNYRNDNDTIFKYDANNLDDVNKVKSISLSRTKSRIVQKEPFAVPPTDLRYYQKGKMGNDL